MNGTATPASPSRPGAHRGGKGGGSGDESTRVARSSGRSRGRRGGSRLALSKPINQADLSPLTSDGQPNGDASSYDSAAESSDELDSIRQERFGKIQAGNQYEQLKVKRESERKLAMKMGLIDHPDKPRSLSDAIRFVGTCEDMCPEFEMHQREYQNNVEKWEINPDTGRIDKSRAVKAFHRPAAGNEQPLPSDVRPPVVLMKTLDYLFSTVLEGGGDIYATHAFIRDRTRSIRQDFTVQNYRGREAIECHERIARYHILCLHCLCDNPNFSEQQEMEQLRKVLQSLVEFYKDNKKSSAPFPLPNEAEFRSYYALVFLRDQDVSRQLETLPEDIFFSEPMMRSLSFRSLAQRSNDRFVQNNSEAAQNLFTRFFRSLKSSATYLEACILETWFGSIRTGALKALRQAFGGMKAVQISQVSVEVLVSMLGFDDTEQLVAFCNYLGLELVLDENGRPIAVWFKRNVTWEEPATYLHQFSHNIVEAKRRTQTYQSVVNGHHLLGPEKKSEDMRTNLWVSGNQKEKPSVLSNDLAPSAFTHKNTLGLTTNSSSITFQPAEQLSNLSRYTTSTSSLGEQQNMRHVNPPLYVPVPQRAQKSPILKFDSPGPITGTRASQLQQSVVPPPNTTFSQPQPNISIFSPSDVVSNSLPLSTYSEVTGNAEPKPSPSPLMKEKSSTQSTISLRHQSLLDRQEKLLHEELAVGERERQSRLDLADQERRSILELGRLQMIERAQLRQKEAVALRAQKLAAQAKEQHNRGLSEQRKIQNEKIIQLYAEEIVDTIVQEQIFANTAAALAVAFHRKRLLYKATRRLKFVCARSLRRKQALLEKLAQSRQRRALVSRALTELSSGVSTSNLYNLKGHRSHHVHSVGNEDEFEHILSKASEEAKEIWKPMDINTVISPYVDEALSREGYHPSEWDLLMLSAGDGLTEGTRWLKTKFGLFGKTENDICLSNGRSHARIVWSPVMQFTGSLRNVGALIFIYEGSALTPRPDDSNSQILLHEVVRQTSLQSQYTYPVLVINFNDQQINASEVARELDLDRLSQLTTSVSAFQVLTIGVFGDANLETSVRSFMRHVSAGLNTNQHDPDNDRKRKRGSDSNAISHVIQSPAVLRSLAGSISPPKRVRNLDDDIAPPLEAEGKLPRLIESLYESIMSAQTELELGRAWQSNCLEDM